MTLGLWKSRRSPHPGAHAFGHHDRCDRELQREALQSFRVQGLRPPRRHRAVSDFRASFFDPLRQRADSLTECSTNGDFLATRNAARYSCSVKIRHKGLRALHERDDRAQLPAHLVPRLRRILFRLQEATHPRSADAPGFRLHPLKGDRADEWSVRVSGNWRVVFRFVDGEAVDVDLIDYH